MRIPDATLEDARRPITAFFETAVSATLAALRPMLEQPYRDGGRSRGRAGRALFGAAKAAVNTFVLGVARDHKNDGIVANALILGGVAFAGAEQFYTPEEFKAAATPEEVADVLAFLASDRSSGINGALVDLNARELD